jgi:hypothetical protein
MKEFQSQSQSQFQSQGQLIHSSRIHVFQFPTISNLIQISVSWVIHIQQSIILPRFNRSVQLFRVSGSDSHRNESSISGLLPDCRTSTGRTISLPPAFVDIHQHVPVRDRLRFKLLSLALMHSSIRTDWNSVLWPIGIYNTSLCCLRRWSDDRLRLGR